MSEIQRLRQIVTQLRAPDGCPWDREQTHHSLLRCLVEEVSEVLEAVDNDDFELMEEELGDLLLQVVMHACLAEEQNHFDFEDVARGISDKLIRRHPHVFGEKAEKVDTTGEVIDRWELIKAEEKKKKFGENEKISIFKNLPPRLPALLFANDIYKRVAKNGLEGKGEWEESNANGSAQELNEGLAGKALFELVAACQKSGIDPELALRKFSSAQVKKLED
ncbi:MAG: MazG family protein [Opitutales bacterium]|nr:MazG family protein [Opitutales bacterium]MDG1326712.1 MazG family protein [Opitutales bacterium]